MSSFKITIYNLIRDALRAEASSYGATGATLASMDSMADTLADGVANAVHDQLMEDFSSASSAARTLDTALVSFMNAFTGWVPSPGDGGSALKAACAASAAQVSSASTALSSALTTLEASISAYVGL